MMVVIERFSYLQLSPTTKKTDRGKGQLEDVKIGFSQQTSVKTFLRRY